MQSNIVNNCQTTQLVGPPTPTNPTSESQHCQLESSQVKTSQDMTGHVMRQHEVKTCLGESGQVRKKQVQLGWV
jgi:hypothetical protein